MIVSIGLILSGFGIWAYGRFSKKGEPDIDLPNFDLLLKNANVSENKDGIASIKFNSGSNVANFYKNGRVAFFKGDNLISKGTYTNGGLTITIDGKAPISTSSVYLTISKSIQ